MHDKPDIECVLEYLAEFEKMPKVPDGALITYTQEVWGGPRNTVYMIEGVHEGRWVAAPRTEAWHRELYRLYKLLDSLEACTKAWRREVYRLYKISDTLKAGSPEAHEVMTQLDDHLDDSTTYLPWRYQETTRIYP